MKTVVRHRVPVMWRHESQWQKYAFTGNAVVGKVISCLAELHKHVAFTVLVSLAIVRIGLYNCLPIFSL